MQTYLVKCDTCHDVLDIGATFVEARASKADHNAETGHAAKIDTDDHLRR